MLRRLTIPVIDLVSINLWSFYQTVPIRIKCRTTMQIVCKQSQTRLKRVAVHNLTKQHHQSLPASCESRWSGIREAFLRRGTGIHPITRRCVQSIKHSFSVVLDDISGELMFDLNYKWKIVSIERMVENKILRQRFRSPSFCVDSCNELSLSQVPLAYVRNSQFF